MRAKQGAVEHQEQGRADTRSAGSTDGIMTGTKGVNIYLAYHGGLEEKLSMSITSRSGEVLTEVPGTVRALNGGAGYGVGSPYPPRCLGWNIQVCLFGRLTAGVLEETLGVKEHELAIRLTCFERASIKPDEDTIAIILIRLSLNKFS
ncbi:conserved hypothetical protein [Coccidioides posadasii str. Silveira]|uniref:Uncharacterized protein n=1 Tax=Coccidioides posadasii (strain RMSCC 757 / Silveira) TaxID=443226 RepID=E9DHI2_COCPS|nr:conserved hypothetical protein [Coccidioides posadasii str. Silveira]